VRGLLATAGETARVADLRGVGVDAELAAAREAERELRRELADLSSGRRLARFASERSASSDYRTHLGLVSRIHEDFVQMSKILARQGASAPGEGTDEASDLPRIERIVLYVDDLDRCPPKRVVEVLEAVHLILAVPLFVVVIAVDPRWLLQSLRLHYSELLAAVAVETATGDGDEEEWQSTPIHYLEKIIQLPFALRPMGHGGVESLVHGLLPIEVGPDHVPVPAAGVAEVPPASSATVTDASAQPLDVETIAPAKKPPPRPALRPPSLSPRALALTEAERDFAVTVAAVLRTPRTVKKFTNLYRLLRAGLDEPSGQLDAFLADDGPDAAEFRAVLILLGAIIAFPDDASAFLLGLGDLGADSQAGGSWTEHVEELVGPESCCRELGEFLQTATPPDERSAAWTCEPFRQWALEVSRYSFATGQEVFAQVQATFTR
jgi:KAP-like P-loop domain-containing protein